MRHASRILALVLLPLACAADGADDRGKALIEKQERQAIKGLGEIRLGCYLRGKLIGWKYVSIIKRGQGGHGAYDIRLRSYVVHGAERGITRWNAEVFKNFRVKDTRYRSVHTKEGQDTRERLTWVGWDGIFHWTSTFPGGGAGVAGKFDRTEEPNGIPFELMAPEFLLALKVDQPTAFRVLDMRIPSAPRVTYVRGAEKTRRIAGQDHRVVLVRITRKDAKLTAYIASPTGKLIELRRDDENRVWSAISARQLEDARKSIGAIYPTTTPISVVCARLAESSTSKDGPWIKTPTPKARSPLAYRRFCKEKITGDKATVWLRWSYKLATVTLTRTGKEWRVHKVVYPD